MRHAIFAPHAPQHNTILPPLVFPRPQPSHSRRSPAPHMVMMPHWRLLQAAALGLPLGAPVPDSQAWYGQALLRLRSLLVSPACH